MNIKTKLKVNTMLFIGIALIMSLFILSTSQQAKKAMDRQQMADKIVRGVFELHILTTDYFTLNSTDLIRFNLINSSNVR